MTTTTTTTTVMAEAAEANPDNVEWEPGLDPPADFEEGVRQALDDLRAALNNAKQALKRWERLYNNGWGDLSRDNGRLDEFVEQRGPMRNLWHEVIFYRKRYNRVIKDMREGLAKDERERAQRELAASYWKSKVTEGSSLRDEWYAFCDGYAFYAAVVKDMRDN